MKKDMGYVLLLSACVLSVTACGNFGRIQKGFYGEVSEGYDMAISCESSEGEGTEGFAEVSGRVNREEQKQSDSFGEDSLKEEAARKEEQKKVFAEEETIFDGVFPVTGALFLYINEGGTGISRVMYDKAAAEKSLADILETDAERVEDWTPEMAALPVYEISVYGGDGRIVSAAWCNGYWFSPNGVPYEMAYDFEALIAAYDWDEQSTSDTSGILLKWEWFNRDGWFPCTLRPAGDVPEPQEGITAKVLSMEDNILTVEITNSGTESWLYGEMFDLDFLLDGVWYDMPPLRDAWGFDDYGLVLDSGESVERDYDFTMYFGILPEGNYRLRISDDKLAVEFAVE